MTTANATYGLLRQAQTHLYYAREARGHREAWDQASAAGDTLFAAAQIAPEPTCSELFRLWRILTQALARSKGLHPSDQVLEAIETALDEIVAGLKIP
jgi:hypothetical protein